MTGNASADGGKTQLYIGFHHDDSLRYEVHLDSYPEAIYTDDPFDQQFYASNYEVQALDDGTYLLSGTTGTADPSGPMYGDAFEWEPEADVGILDWEFDIPEGHEDEVWLEVNGTEVGPDEFPKVDEDDDSGRTDEESQLYIGFHHDDSLRYRVHIDGNPEAIYTDDPFDQQFYASNYEVQALDDGTYLLSGSTGTADPSGPMYGDAFKWEPDEDIGILGWEFGIPEGHEDEVWLEVNGLEVGPDEYPEIDRGEGVPVEDETQLYVGFHHDDSLRYEVHTDGNPEAIYTDDPFDQQFYASNYEVQALDDGTYLLSGSTGTADPSGPMYGDAFKWEPDEDVGILGWEFDIPEGHEDEVWLEVNGTEVSPDEYPGIDADEEPSHDGIGIRHDRYEGPIGGGEGYPDVLSRADADYAVSDLDDLRAAADAAGDGDVVWIEEDETIYLDGTTITFDQDDLTLASSRGDGTPGCLEMEDWTSVSWETVMLVFNGDNVRVTGLVMDGNVPVGADPNYGDSSPRPRGFELNGQDCLVDNCELHNWSCAMALSGTDQRAVIRQNHFHENAQSGLGYGIQMGSSSADQDNRNIVEYNVSDTDRHLVPGSNSWYEARDNRIDEQTSHVFEVRAGSQDVGEPCGNAYVHHNELHSDTSAQGSDGTRLMAIRGVPTEGVWLENNWAHWDSEPQANDGYWGSEGVVVQPFSDEAPEFSNVAFEDNHWGESDPA